MTTPLEKMLEVAAGQHGLITVAQAREAGVASSEVRRHAQRGWLERRSHGIYRIASIPFDEYSEYAEAVLWTRGEGVIGSETALVLWELADVNPRKIDVVAPSGYRPKRQGAERYRIIYERLGAADVDHVVNVTTVVPAIAIRQATERGTPGDLIEQALTQAQARGLLDKRGAARLLLDLDARATG